MNATTVHAETIFEKYKVDQNIASAIIKCESNWDEDALHVNKNGSVDYGLFQINSVHKSDMAKLGLDITKHNDSFVYGLILMRDSGLAPWQSSRACWDKLI